MTQTQAHQGVEPSAGLEFIESAESPEHLLADLMTFAQAMDNLARLVGAGAFDSEKHRLLLRATIISHRWKHGRNRE